MIKNERQYRITKSQVEKFKRALKILKDKADDFAQSSNRQLMEVQKNALKSQLAELKADIKEHEALVTGKIKTLKFSSLEELPNIMIQARIARGFTQKELASRLGMKEQLLQRYESTNYSHVSLSRLLEIADYLGIKVKGQSHFN